jgi:hypothetical protein
MGDGTNHSRQGHHHLARLLADHQRPVAPCAPRTGTAAPHDRAAVKGTRAAEPTTAGPRTTPRPSAHTTTADAHVGSVPGGRLCFMDPARRTWLTHVCGLPLPTLLLEMLDDGRWQDPGEQALDRVMPWADDPRKFLMLTTDQMRRETEGLAYAAEGDEYAPLFQAVRGSARAEPVELPWLDLDLAVLIGGARQSDATNIALDYRTGAADPRVVASAFPQVGWRVVAPTFSAFVAAVGLTSPLN